MFSFRRHRDRYVSSTATSKFDNIAETTDKVKKSVIDERSNHTSEQNEDDLEPSLPSISPRSKDYVKLLQGMKLILESLIKENNKDIDRVSYKNEEHERMIRNLIRMIITPNA